jgi:hypothetical protein
MHVSQLGWREVAFEQDWQANRDGHGITIVGKGRSSDDDAHRETRFCIKPERRAGEHGAEEIGPRRLLQWIENGIARIAESTSEFERPDAVLVDDGVEVDIAAIAVLSEERRHVGESAIEKAL